MTVMKKLLGGAALFCAVNSVAFALDPVPFSYYAKDNTTFVQSTQVDVKLVISDPLNGISGLEITKSNALVNNYGLFKFDLNNADWTGLSNVTGSATMKVYTKLPANTDYTLVGTVNLKDYLNNMQVGIGTYIPGVGVKVDPSHELALTNFNPATGNTVANYQLPVYNTTTPGQNRPNAILMTDGEKTGWFTLGSGQILIGDVNGNPQSAGVNGDISLNYDGNALIADGAVNSKKIKDGAIVDADVNADAAIAGTKINPNFGTQAINGGLITVTGAQVNGDANVTGALTAKTLTGDLAIGNLTGLAKDQVILGTTGDPAATTLTGDVTITDGTTIIGTGKVNSDKILNGTIKNEDVAADAAIAGTKVTPDFGAQNITTTGNATVNQLNSKVIVNDNSITTGDITVNKDAFLNGNTTIGDAKGTDVLTVNATTTIANPMTTNGITNTGAITSTGALTNTGVLTNNGDVTFTGTLTNNGDVTITGTTNAQAINGTDGHFTGNLQVDGNTVLGDNAKQDDVTINAKNTTINMDSDTPAFTINNLRASTTPFTVTGTAADEAIALNANKINITGATDIAGATRLHGGDLTINNDKVYLDNTAHNGSVDIVTSTAVAEMDKLTATITTANVTTGTLTENTTTKNVKIGTLNEDITTTNVTNGTINYNGTQINVNDGAKIQYDGTGRVIANELTMDKTNKDDTKFLDLYEHATAAVPPTANIYYFDQTNKKWTYEDLKAKDAVNMTTDLAIPRWDMAKDELVDGSMTDDSKGNVTLKGATSKFKAEGTIEATGNITTTTGNLVAGTDKFVAASDGSVLAEGPVMINGTGMTGTDVLTVAEGNVSFAEDLAVTGNTTVGGTLDVTGATTLKDKLDVTGNTTVGGTLDVTGATTLKDKLDVTGNTTVGGTLDVTGATTLKDKLDVTGNTTVGGTLDVTGATTLKDKLDVTGNTTVGGTLEVAKDATLNGDNNDINGIVTISDAGKSTTIEGNLTVAENADLNGANNNINGIVTISDAGKSTTVEGNLTVAENADLNGANNNINGIVTISDAGKSTTVEGNLTVAENATLNGANNDINGIVTISDAGKSTTVEGNLTVDENATLDGDNNDINGIVTISDAGKSTTVEGTLQVDEDANLNGDNTTIGDAATDNLLVKSITKIDNTLNVTGDTDLDANLNVDENTVLGSDPAVNTLTVDAITDINGATTINNTLTVADNFATLLGGTLEVKDNTTLDKDLWVKGIGEFGVDDPTTPIASKITVYDNIISTNVDNGDIVIDGGATDGSKISGLWTLDATHDHTAKKGLVEANQFELWNNAAVATETSDNWKGVTMTTNSTGAQVMIGKEGTLPKTGNLTVTGNTILKNNTNIGDDKAVDILTVNAKTNLEGELNVKSNSSFTGTAAFNGTTSFNMMSTFNGGQTFNGGATFTGSNTFSPVAPAKTVFTGLVDFSGATTTGLTFDNLNVAHNTTLGTAATDNLLVNATSTFAAPVTMTGALNANGVVNASAALNVTGLASLDGGIDVNGSSFAVDAAGNTTAKGTLGVTGKASVGALQVGTTATAGQVLTADANGNATWQTTTPAPLSDGKIWIGNGSNVAVENALSGDVTMSNTGVTTIGALKVQEGMLAADAVTTGKIANGTIVKADIDPLAPVAYTDAANIFTQPQQINSTLGVTGKATLGADLDVAGNTSLGGTLTVATGKLTTLDGLNAQATTLNTLGVTGATTLAGATSSALFDINVAAGADAIHSANGNITLDNGTVTANTFAGNLTGNASGVVDTAGDNVIAAINNVATTDKIDWARVDHPVLFAGDLQTGHIYVGDATNKAADVAVSGDISISTAGLVTIANNVVTSAKILDGTIEAADIKDATVTAGKIAPSGTNDQVLTTVGGVVTWKTPTAMTGQAIVTAINGQTSKINWANIANTSTDLFAGTAANATNAAHAALLDNTAVAGESAITAINTTTLAAINGTKVIPDFGAQNIITTGTVTAPTFSGALNGNATTATTADAIKSGNGNGLVNVINEATTTVKIDADKVDLSAFVPATATTADLLKADAAAGTSAVNAINLSTSKINWTNVNVPTNLAVKDADNNFTTGQTVTGTVTATSFSGPLTGNVTGNVTGNLTGNVTGDVTGDLTGDVTGNVTGDVTGDLTGTADEAKAVTNAAGTSVIGAINANTGKINWANIANAATDNFAGKAATAGTADKLDATAAAGNSAIDAINVSSVTGTINWNRIKTVATDNFAGTAETAKTVANDAITTDKILNGTIATADLADGAVTNIKLAADAVTTDKILNGTIATDDLADGAVTTAKLAADAVTSAKIADGTIATADLAADAVTTDKILNGTIATADLADNAVATAKIADLAVATGKLADNAVTTAKIADLNVTTAKLAADAVTSEKIKDGEVKTLDLAADAVTTAKIADLAVTNGKLAADAVTTAKIKDFNVTTAKLAADAVTTAKIADLAVTNDKLGVAAVTSDKIFDGSILAVDLADGAVTTVKIADLNVTTGKLAADAVTSEKIKDGEVKTLDLADNAVTVGKIAAGTDGYVLTTVSGATQWAAPVAVSPVGTNLANGNIWLGNATGKAAAVAMSGDVTIDNTGATTIGTDKVTSAKILDATIIAADLAANAVTTAKIADLNVTTDKLAADAVTSAKIADGTIATADLADNAVTTDKILNGTIATDDLADGAVTTAKLAADAVTSAKIADGTIATADLADNAVTTDKILNGTIATADLADNAVTTAKIADLNVTTGKLAADAVTSDKLATNLSLTGTTTLEGVSLTGALDVTSTGSIQYSPGTLKYGTAAVADAALTVGASGVVTPDKITAATIKPGTDGQILLTSGTATTWSNTLPALSGLTVGTGANGVTIGATGITASGTAGTVSATTVSAKTITGVQKMGIQEFASEITFIAGLAAGIAAGNSFFDVTMANDFTFPTLTAAEAGTLMYVHNTGVDVGILGVDNAPSQLLAGDAITMIWTGTAWVALSAL